MVRADPMPEEPQGRGLGNAILSFLLSWGVAAALLAGLIWFGGIWNILANTRLLDLCIEGGIIRYHDGNLGIVDGIDKQETYLNSQDPIDYRLVLIAALIYFLYWGAKGIQFHGIARFVGMKGGAGGHARAWLYGEGVARFIPFRFGEAATTMSLEAQGEEPAKAEQAFRVMDFLILHFEIILFLVFGLLVTTYPIWFAQQIWAVIILAAAFFLARGIGLRRSEPGAYGGSYVGTYRALADRPSTFVKLGALSALCMLLDDLTPFIMAMAFTGDNVILNVPFFVIQSGVVAGYIAKRIPLTPHGIGQWEWAFAMALYLSGVGFPEAATIALLDSVLRWTTGTIVFLCVILGKGAGTSFSAVLKRYIGGEEEGPAPAAAPAMAEPVR